MQLREIAHTTSAEIVTDIPVNNLVCEYGFASDLMSDVLTINAEQLLLITGLNNLQAIRTAEMAEIRAILFARNKRPTPAMIDLANREGIILMVTEKSMFHVSGLLFGTGLKPLF